MMDRTKILSHLTKEELLSLIQQKDSFMKSNAIKDRDEVVSILRTQNVGYDKENLFVVVFNRQSNIVDILIYQSGCKDAIKFDVDLVLKDILRVPNANAIIMAHNHPEGGVKHSEADLISTMQISAGIHLIGLSLWDSVVFDSFDYSSIMTDNRKTVLKFFKDINKAFKHEVFKEI